MYSLQFVGRALAEFQRRFGAQEEATLDFLRTALTSAYDLGYQHAKDGARVRTRPVMPPETWPGGQSR